MKTEEGFWRSNLSSTLSSRRCCKCDHFEATPSLRLRLSKSSALNLLLQSPERYHVMILHMVEGLRRPAKHTSSPTAGPCVSMPELPRTLHAWVVGFRSFTSILGIDNRATHIDGTTSSTHVDTNKRENKEVVFEHVCCESNRLESKLIKLVPTVLHLAPTELVSLSSLVCCTSSCTSYSMLSSTRGCHN